MSEAIYRWRGFRPVQLDSFKVNVLPYDKRFWDGVDRGTWEPETFAALSAVLCPGTEYCDIGAWIGPTVLFARKLGARVTCFEPDPLAYERLLGNLRLNSALDVRCFHCALGSTDGTRTMGAMVGSLGKSATSFFGVAAAQTVQVASLRWETAKRLFDFPRFEVIKMDVEGGEVELLPGMLDYLQEVRPTFLLSTHWSFLPEDRRQSLVASLARLGKIYGSVTAFSDSIAEPVDLSDPLTPTRQSAFLLKP